VEFGAHGLDVDVAWRDGGRITASGNSFAAPHIAGYAALIRAKHPEVTPFEVKAILAATATPPAPEQEVARPRTGKSAVPGGSERPTSGSRELDQRR